MTLGDDNLPDPPLAAPREPVVHGLPIEIAVVVIGIDERRTKGVVDAAEVLVRCL